MDDTDAEMAAKRLAYELPQFNWLENKIHGIQVTKPKSPLPGKAKSTESTSQPKDGGRVKNTPSGGNLKGLASAQKAAAPKASTLVNSTDNAKAATVSDKKLGGEEKGLIDKQVLPQNRSDSVAPEATEKNKNVPSHLGGRYEPRKEAPSQIRPHVAPGNPTSGASLPVPKTSLPDVQAPQKSSGNDR